MDIRKVKTLIELIRNTDITELEIQEGEESLRLSRGSQQPLSSSFVMQTTPSINQERFPQVEQPTPNSDDDEEQSIGHIIRSPMVGTMYIAPSPGMKPFVEVGQHVEVGDSLCVVEAMKMFNTIEADAAGTVTARLVENGQPVEFDQPLFIIE